MPVLGVLLSVIPQVAHAEYGLRLRADPPVDQIEMVCCLVHHESAAVAFVAVPASKVVGAMTGVQQPLEVYAEYLTDGAALDKFLDFAVARCVTIVEGHAQVAFGGLNRVDDLLALFSIGCHRLFADDIAA